MHHFFAYLSRLKYICRWNLMRNVKRENVMEHTCQVAMIAHGLALLENTRHAGTYSPERAATLALFHEAGEVITGDLVTPIKYFNPDIHRSFAEIEKVAVQKIAQMLPDDLQKEYQPVLLSPQDEKEWPLVKAADRLCAYLKCAEELKSGNEEFRKASESILASIEKSPFASVADFMREFAPSYALALDELNE